MKRMTVVVFSILALAMACEETPVDPEPTTPTVTPTTPTTPAPTTPRFSEVRIGMNRAQVVELMGTPTDSSTFTYGESVYVTLTWSRFSSYTYDWIYYYTVDFTDGVVTSKFSG